jgi:methyltransferase family protein
MKKTDVADYLRATADVEGWFFPIDAYAFAMFDEIQRREGISGNLFEIGVHHGKTAIFLAREAAQGETVGVCDVFENQELNVDRSGEGSRELFLANMRAKASLPAERLCIFAKRSAALTSDETTTRCRFFHIDGGHRPEDVFADLVTADRAVLPDGIVSVDDVFNSNWPGVSEGFYNFIATRPDGFVPLFIGGNKVFFARPDAAERYERYWSDDGAWQEFFDPGPFTFDFKEWLGRRVLTAVRSAWVDLDPIAAARLHLGPSSWRERILRSLRGQ